MSDNPTAPRSSLVLTVGLVWLIALVAVPLASFVLAPLGTLLGLRGPCADFDSVGSAVIAAYIGVAAGVILTLTVVIVRAVSGKGQSRAWATLVSCAVVAFALSVWISGHAIIAAYIGAPAAGLFALTFLVTRALGLTGSRWTWVTLALYAVAAFVFSVWFSGMCK